MKSDPAVVEINITGNEKGQAKSTGEKRKSENVTLDDAMEQAGFGKFNLIMLVFCGTLMLGMILETLGFSYIIPASQCDLDLTPASKGWVAAIPFAGFILTSHLWGWVADNKGRRKALLLSMSIGSTFSVLSSFAPEVISFVVLRFFAALFIAGGAALGYAFLGEFSPGSHRDKMIALANASVALGTAVVPLVSWAVLPSDFRLPYLPDTPYRPWRLLVCCFAAPYVICSIVILRIPESPKFLATQGRREEALTVLKKIYAINSGMSGDEFNVKSLADEAITARSTSALTSFWQQTTDMFKRPWLGYSLLVCTLHFVSFAVSNGFYIWLPEVINRLWSRTSTMDSDNLCSMITNIAHQKIISSRNSTIDGSSEALATCDDSLKTEAFTVTIAISAFITIFTCVVAFFVHRIGKKTVLLAIFLVATICSFALHWTTNTITSVIFFCSFQLCSTSIGLINAFIVQIYPTNMRAMAVCVAMMFGRVGSMVFSKGIGTLLEINCPSCFFTASALLAVSAAITLLLPGNKKIEETRL